MSTPRKLPAPKPDTEIVIGSFSLFKTQKNTVWIENDECDGREIAGPLIAKLQALLAAFWDTHF